jgi:predicted enzyme related to lactoylglutathione lyase
MARIMYIGAVVIHASQPKELARWYSEKFGMPATFEHRGGFFGGFETAAGPVHIAIVPKEDSGVAAQGNMSVTFRVNDYAGYLRELRNHGLEPVGTSRDDAGQFATFRDPEGNEVAIWGD